MKKLLIVLAILFLGVLASADSISQYKIQSTIYMNELITITGVFDDGGGSDANQLCSFYILDMNGYLIERPDDEYTDGLGRFSSSSLRLTQPPFFVGEDYNVVTICDIAQTDSNFQAGNLRDVAFGVSMSWAWLTDRKNIDTFFVFGGILIFVLLFTGGMYYAYRMASAKVRF